MHAAVLAQRFCLLAQGGQGGGAEGGGVGLEGVGGASSFGGLPWGDAVLQACKAWSNGGVSVKKSSMS